MIASFHKLQLFQIPSTSLFLGVEWQLELFRCRSYLN